MRPVLQSTVSAVVQSLHATAKALLSSVKNMNTEKLSRFRYLTVTVFGAGRIPFAPGTFACVPATILGFGVLHFTDAPVTAIIFALLAATASGLSVSFTPGSELQFEAKDPGQHVIDEVAGQFTTLAVVFALPPASPVSALIISFLSFRLFDILKPPPIKSLERLSGGWGVTLDDILAGIYAGGTTLLLRILF